MSDKFKIRDTNRGNEREAESRSEAEETKNDLVSLGADPTHIEIVPPGETDGGTEAVDAEVVDHTDEKEDADHIVPCGICGDDVDVTQPTAASGGGGKPVHKDCVTEDESAPKPTPADADDLPDDPPIDSDPVQWLPSHFVDTIQGVPTVNRKGYAVIASKYGISVTSEPVTLPSDTDFEYAEFRATAVTPDGKEYSGFGSAHVDRQDGDDKYLLAELAETRAMKRAVAWSSGVGMTAASELMGDL